MYGAQLQPHPTFLPSNKLNTKNVLEANTNRYIFGNMSQGIRFLELNPFI